jgi:ArsR family transcriptional regulator
MPAPLDHERHAAIHKALGDVTRLRILERLPDAPVCAEMYNVTELVEEIGGSQPNMSRHLHILKQAGLVKCRKACSSVYYYRVPEAFEALREVLDRLAEPHGGQADGAPGAAPRGDSE